MKIEIWTDIGCPFCYIGNQRLHKVLSKIEHKSNVEVIYRAFPIDPNAPERAE